MGGRGKSAGVNPIILAGIIACSFLIAFLGSQALQAACVFVHLAFAFLLSDHYMWLRRLSLLSCISFAFFFVVYGISFPSFVLSQSGVSLAFASWLRIVLILTSVIAGSQLVKRRRLFATLIRLGVPTYFMYPLFQGFALVERFQEKAASVLLALRLRGLRLRGPISRLLALVDAFAALFNGVLVEVDQRDLAHSAHGYHLMRPARTAPPEKMLMGLDLIYLVLWMGLFTLGFWQWKI